MNLSAARERRAQPVEGAAAEQSKVNQPAYMLPHPYLGFVLNPALDSPTRTANRGGHAINELGHVGDASPLWSPPEDTFVVAVFGGSVAYRFRDQGMVPVVDAIRKSRELGDREVEIVRFALGGYKQPQMLLTLSYLLSLGARFDLIINLDGFNDIVLGAHDNDNIPVGVSVDFPRGWRSMTATQPTHAELIHMAAINELTQQRTWLAEFTSHPLLYHSSMVSLSWIMIDRILQRR